MAEKSSKESLPFEPRKKKQKSEPKSVTKSLASSKAATKTKSAPKSSKNRENASLSAIPDAVSKRMTRRMVFFSGIPTLMGITSFFIFYWLFAQKILEFPPYLVLIVTAGLFGLGFVGLSYSVFSASWDEERDGGLVGFVEFKTNFGRTVSAWKNRGHES
jgi:hypothetical protein